MQPTPTTSPTTKPAEGNPTALPRFVLYARKSTESEDRQVQSLDDQVALAQKLAQERGFRIVHSIAEAHSAKAQGTRKGFKEVVQWVETSKADGIICWHPDRLARNAVDGGWVLDLLDRGKLKHLVFTSGYHFDDTPESKFMLGMVFSQAKYQVDKLIKDVTRGMVSKREKGGFPHRAPEGWKNVRIEATGEKTIVVDTERFKLLRQAIDLILSDTQVPAQALQILNHEWGYQTRPSKRRASGPLPYASFYGLLSNPFLKGMCRHAGGVYKGSHTTMVTSGEFDQLQAVLTRKEKHRTAVRNGSLPSRLSRAVADAASFSSPPRVPRHDFAFTGLLRCGRCGSGMITATCAKGHFYYHCTNAKRNCAKRCVREETIREEVQTYLDAVYFPDSLSQQLLDLTHRHIEALGVDRAEREVSARARQEAALAQVQAQQTKLRDLLLREVLSEADYASEKARLAGKEAMLQAQLHTHTSEAEEREAMKHTAQTVIAFATTAPLGFATATPAEQRQIVRYLSGLVLPEGMHPRPRLNANQTAQKVFLEPHPHLAPFAAYLASSGPVKPGESGSDKQKRPQISRSVLLGAGDETLDKLAEGLCQQVRQFPSPPHSSFANST